MKLKVIGCDVLTREIYFCASLSPHTIDIDMLDSINHEKPELMHVLLQEKINSIESGYDYILIGFGLCGKVVNNIKCHKIPLVIPRVHDCISMFMGSKEKYEKFFIENPGTMFYVEEWAERKGLLNERKELESVGLTKGMDFYIKKYGREVAEYLYETLGEWKKYYNKALYLYNENMKKKYMNGIKKIATNRNWEYCEMKINDNLIQKFLNAEWDEKEFLIVEPGKIVQHVINDRLIDKF